MIDRNFRTIADKDHRALAGLSMGGMETKEIGLRRPDVFGWLGIFSGGTISKEEADAAAGFRKNNRLTFVSYGSREVEGGRQGGDQRYSPMNSTHQAPRLCTMYQIRPLTSGRHGAEACTSSHSFSGNS